MGKCLEHWGTAAMTAGIWGGPMQRVARALIQRPFDDIAIWLCAAVLLGFAAINLSGFWIAS